MQSWVAWPYPVTELCLLSVQDLGLNQVFPLTSGRQFFTSTPNPTAPNFACYQGTWRVTYPSLVADIFRSCKKRIQKSTRHRTFPSIAGSHHPHACTTKEFLSVFLACLQSYSWAPSWGSWTSIGEDWQALFCVGFLRNLNCYAHSNLTFKSLLNF